MSQSATLYRISNKDFEKSESGKQQLISKAKDYVTLEQSFLGLDFILKKGEDKKTEKIIDELFNPKAEDLDWASIDFDSLSGEDENELFSGSNSVCFLPTEKVKEISKILNRLTKEEIASRYDSDELNEKNIYPCVWHNDNSPDKAFNLNNILEDFKKLRNIINKSDKEGDYILQFIG